MISALLAVAVNGVAMQVPNLTPRCSVWMQYGQQQYGQQQQNGQQQYGQQQYGQPPQDDSDATRDESPPVWQQFTWRIAGTETPGSRNKDPGMILEGAYSIGNGEQQALGRFDMPQTRGRPAYYVSRQQCLIQVAPDGEAMLTSIGKPPTGWRAGPGQPWRWISKKKNGRPSEPIVLNSGAQISLNKYEKEGAVFTCQKQSGAPVRAAPAPNEGSYRYDQQGAYGEGYPRGGYSQPQGGYGQQGGYGDQYPQQGYPPQGPPPQQGGYY